MSATVFEEQLAELGKAADRLREAELAVVRARRDLYAKVMSAYKGGMRPLHIIEATGISRQRLHQIRQAHNA